MFAGVFSVPRRYRLVEAARPGLQDQPPWISPPGTVMALTSTFDIDAPRWDQSTFMGRLKHFFNITDWRTALLPDSRLDEAKALVESCRAGSVPPGTTEEQLHYAKKLYDSAFHPDTGDRMNLIGRMSFQVPGGMAITGAMLQFYRHVLDGLVFPGRSPAVVFWQWVNQSFNALVNYTNRNAASSITPKQIGVAYVTATSTALATAVGLNLYTKRAPPLVARWVPFVAVAAANCVNIPMMRQQEILNGIAVTDENGNKLGHSKKAAAKGITQVVISRITMAAPGMIILPIIMQRLEKYKFMQRITYLHGPIQVMMVGVFLVFMVPAACSLFPQKCSIAVSKLEPELRDAILSKHGDGVQSVYFNKGL
ncbi:sideroflexin-2 [Entelurus aequoreus]|uniref:sideroflexin-2 n=1 Tax=Entelurus aequoreus TaxID=161455 RepID=UPI002B1DB9E1|nr:sideroflexin-2 [Entelurus aequoreus]